MKGRDGFIQAYNGQAAVDADAQIIVAHRLTNNGSDQDALPALLDAVAIAALVQRPISKASLPARCAVTWRRGAQAGPMAARKAASWFRPCVPGSGKADTAVAIECENTPSNPYSGTSNKPAASANSSSAASIRSEPNGP